MSNEKEGQQIFGIEDASEYVGLSKRQLKYYVYTVKALLPHTFGKVLAFTREQLDMFIVQKSAFDKLSRNERPFVQWTPLPFPDGVWFRSEDAAEYAGTYKLKLRNEGVKCYQLARQVDGTKRNRFGSLVYHVSDLDQFKQTLSK